jgi:lysyl-tRNA synthetase class 2
MLKTNWEKIRDQELDRSLFEKRAHILSHIREFFVAAEFVEVETPLVVKHPGTEPYLNLFKTQFIQNEKAEPGYLITSPELQMKKLLAAGFTKIFQISKSFRNGETGGNLHNPEFTIMEWYRTNADYFDIMRDTEALIKFILKKQRCPHPHRYQNKTINLQAAWDRKKVNDLFIEYLNLDLNTCKTPESFHRAAQARGFEFPQTYLWNDIFYHLFLTRIEPYLGIETPVFVYDYPAAQAALCRPADSDPFWAERFELYIGGIELSNAFSELIDAQLVEKNFQQDLILRKDLGKDLYPYDQDFVKAMRENLPPCAGIALGIDRLLMLLLDQPAIENVILFPFSNL